MRPAGTRPEARFYGRRIAPLGAFLTAFLFIISLTTSAQVSFRGPARGEIDAKRGGTSLTSPDAMPRSREFIRLDSTYYVGWLFEGSYKFEHASDLVGYRSAAVPLERALALMERDFRKDLGLRTKDVMQLIKAYPRWQDYATIVEKLNTCYLNTEEGEKNYALLRRYLRWNFQIPMFDAYNYLMWVTHRNRYYTKAKYSFLRNNLDENEALANRYLDSGIYLTRRAIAANSGILQPGAFDGLLNSVDHYKAILYSYAVNVDSAEYYYRRLEKNGMISHNNYANFLATIGSFKKASEEYKEAAVQDASNDDKRLREWVYYDAILEINRANPKRGELNLKGMIRAVGTTPGWGWYNIGLARALLYDGQVTESEKYIDKAAAFKELHIGTTLGQPQYEFSVQLNQLIAKDYEYEMQRFENSNWWYNPSVLRKMGILQGEKVLQQFGIINQFAMNPERDQIVYKLFATESTVCWDEVWYLIRDFSTQFFTRRYERALQEDKRPAIKRYFGLFLAQLKMRAGEFKDAYALLNSPQVLTAAGIDPEGEKLFLARTYQALATCAGELKKDAEQVEWLNRMYGTYPQLIPFSGQEMPMRLRISGAEDTKLTDRLKDCHINWLTDATRAPEVSLHFTSLGKTKAVDLVVKDASGTIVVQKQTVYYEDSEAGITARRIAYSLFGVGGKPTDKGPDPRVDI